MISHTIVGVYMMLVMCANIEFIIFPAWAGGKTCFYCYTSHTNIVPIEVMNINSPQGSFKLHNILHNFIICNEIVQNLHKL